MPCCSSACCRSLSAFGPTPCSFFSSAAGTFASSDSVVYPAEANARVAGAPMFLGRLMSCDDMRWMVVRAALRLPRGPRPSVVSWPPAAPGLVSG